MAGSLFGLGGGCFRGDGRPLPSSRLNTECREGGLEGGPANWARPSTAAGTGTELPWRRLGPLLSSALGGENEHTAPAEGPRAITQMVAVSRLQHKSPRLLGKPAFPRGWRKPAALRYPGPLEAATPSFQPRFSTDKHARASS